MPTSSRWLQADVVVVEGVGGFRVPLTEVHDTADLAFALDLPVVLVVGMRLGCISHALLTAEAIASRGLRLAGWVANRVDPDMLYPAENIEAIRLRLDIQYNAPLLGTSSSRAARCPGGGKPYRFDPAIAVASRGQRRSVIHAPSTRIDHMTQAHIAQAQSTQGQTPTQARWRVADVVALYDLPYRLAGSAQTVHREHFDPNTVQLSTLLSIKTGGCEEDCAYCPQSVHHDTGLKADKLMEVDAVLKAAEIANSKARPLLHGRAWRNPKDRHPRTDQGHDSRCEGWGWKRA